ncbi:glycoside hydrolase family 9 protein [Fibrobacter sp. UWB11]|uniref:glycoside hydrolase family 9 protein n=1 Tax=Fibrobacter sp. UWB11 TaxID=1896202 RepID=UPI0009416A2F|nr:glycoside hydrolase family 9 protein [Fibrobacter sp. UWB11]
MFVKNHAIKSVALAALVVVPAFAATAYINQIGYRPGDFKELALVEANGNVDFVNAAGQVVLSVTPKAASYWNASGQNVQLVDFSKLAEAGKYSIKVNGNVLRSDLVVKSQTYEEIVKASIKWFYYQRASMALEEQYAGKWARAAGHTNATAKLHNSTGASGTIQSSKGWYDAGDYGRYIVNSGITTYTLLSLYEHFPQYFKTLKWNIPAEGSLPDLLAEIKYNLDWMLTMQASDGGVYHKLTSLGFPGDVMPAQDNSELYVIGKSTAGTFDFAAVMAMASRIYKPFDATYASKCLEAAKKAYAWGQQNPSRNYLANPSDVSTGAYENDNPNDEKVLAGTELYITTGDASYKQSGSSEYVSYWGDVMGLATYEKATHQTQFGGDASEAKQKILGTADKFVNRAESGFGVVMDKDDFVWGSNAVASNQGVWLLHAYYLTGNQKYYKAAVKALDYLLGKNPLDMSFVTGYGTKSPKMPHHRPSTSDNVEDPIPGMLVGGPQPGGEDVGSAAEWKCADYRTGQAATAYTDQRCSYATNEVAINWNAPLAYLAGAIEAINAGYAPEFAAAGVAKQDVPASSSSTVSSSSSAPQSSSSAVVSSSSETAVSSSSVPSVSLSSSANVESSSSQGTIAIRVPVESNVVRSQQPRFRFDGHSLFVEKNGKRFDLKGQHIK